MPAAKGRTNESNTINNMHEYESTQNKLLTLIWKYFTLFLNLFFT